MITVRLCHDLAGPAGAVNNGVEIFAESSDEMKEKSFELIEASTKDMITRLMLFRKAFGTANKEVESDIVSFQKVVADYTAPKKINVHWQYEQNVIHLNNQLTQMLANMILIACDILMIGGKLTVKLKNLDKKPTISVIGSSTQFKMIPALSALFVEDSADVECDSRNIVCFYLHQLLQHSNLSLKILENDSQFELLLE